MMEIKLDGETADRVTALTLSEHGSMIKQMIHEGKLHDEDLGRYHRLADAVDLLLTEYFQVPR